jgi:uncharacterized protein YgbK (DUF1537 family)
MTDRHVVAADDRTGALEVAAEMASVDAPVPVVVGVHPGEIDARCVVLDIDTRQQSSAIAAARAAAVERLGGSWSAHKIDSTLRGNWRAEMRARMRTGDRRLLLLAAWPAMGRTCVDGVVHVHGTPLASMRDLVTDAWLLHGPDELRNWIERGNQVAVCDVRDDQMLADVAAVAGAAPADILVVGPAGSVGAVARSRMGSPRRAAVPALAGPTIVVCGSATASAHQQLARLAAAHPEVDIVADRPTVGSLVPDVARAVVARAAEMLERRSYSTVVIIGGTTAAALLGDAPRLVGGTVVPGLPWSRSLDGSGPLVITKAGAFGHPDTLVDLFSRSGGEERFR